MIAPFACQLLEPKARVAWQTNVSLRYVSLVVYSCFFLAQVRPSKTNGEGVLYILKSDHENTVLYIYSICMCQALGRVKSLRRLAFKFLCRGNHWVFLSWYFAPANSSWWRSFASPWSSCKATTKNISPQHDRGSINKCLSPSPSKWTLHLIGLQ